MKKIAITGGTSGIGLEIRDQLCADSKKVDNFSRSNGYDLSTDLGIRKIIKRISVGNYDTIFLNAGILSKAKVGSIKNDDIVSLFLTNTIANIKIINSLYEKIKAGDLKVVVTLSTASYINGAEESLYNATKKAIKEFIISANTELINDGSDSRIFSFVPHFIRGTKMTGGTLNKDELSGIVKELLISIKNGKNEYIPKYDDIYKEVFKEYKENPIKQGLQSIEYRRSRDGK